ncbi:hypothetical protein HZA55_09605 [Candidatus Poribacteria bacterium]|nr:hypothetical protein [Candidatus Poribacteria bacterium]
MDNIFTVFWDSKKHILREKDAILNHRNKKEKFFICVSSARNNNKTKSDDIENLILRIKIFFQNKEINKNTKFDITFGYSLVNFLC